MLREQWQAARRQARQWESASEGEQRVSAQLLVLTERGWRLLVDRRWPGTRSANVDMLLVGPAGVFVVDVKNWRADPEVEDGRLLAGGEVRDEHARKLSAVTKTAETAVASLGMSPVAVRPLMVFADKRVDTALGRIRLLGEREVGPYLLAERHRLNAASVRVIADHLGRVFPEYEGSSVTEPATGPVTEPATEPATEPVTEPATASTTAPSTVPRSGRQEQPAAGLFDLDGMREAALDAAMRAPIEQWMTFLAQDQVALVRRNWSGPARISGPAGTGKTVVGLHRASYLAQRTTGRVLYVTFASNLPRVQETFLHAMSPAVADRVEFRSLHSWAQQYTQDRGVPVNLNGDKAETAFSLAWTHAGRDSPLTELDPLPRYWKDEIDYVIKGRGITSFEEYAVLPRRRRRVGLRRPHRQAVWGLYEAYESLRVQRGVHDFNDVLTLALAEASSSTEAAPYAAVIVDEVQDLTLVGVKLLHALIGDAPNGLLLVGDGQQAVYPGGFRLSDAGIDIRGERGQVLSTNYRNSKNILDAALAVVADDAFEDIDGVRSSGAREVDLTYHDGQVRRVDRPTVEDHDRALLEALLALTPAERADSAVLCPSVRAIGRYRDLLTASGLPVCPLERYAGHAVEGVKLGSYRRAKGLEFKRVYLPRYDTSLLTGAEGLSETERERRELGRSQLFVAMTRARDTLWLGSVTPAAQA
ncbi:UvrD-helicase domain-containing protein [Streptomyces sp. NPDC008317]|uniref:nuclease-related domain-containing DEAD/DEAH box helicase n=1 Tax=Streptomyces sp. NPDC008317 TaxID=3364827 RepID=UPI0036E2C9CD